MDNENMHSNIINELNQVFREVLSQPNLIVTPEMSASQVNGWDSMSHVNIIATVERKFKLKFSLKEIISFKCVGDMIGAIESKTRRT